MIKENINTKTQMFFSFKNFWNNKKQKLSNRKKPNLSINASEWLRSVRETKKSWR